MPDDVPTWEEAIGYDWLCENAAIILASGKWKFETDGSGRVAKRRRLDD